MACCNPHVTAMPTAIPPGSRAIIDKGRPSGSMPPMPFAVFDPGRAVAAAAESVTRLLAERVRMRGHTPSPIKRGQRITVPGLSTSPPATNPSRHRSDRSDCVQAPFRSPGRSVNRLSTSQNKIRFSCFQFDFGTKSFPNFLLHLRYFNHTCNMDVKICLPGLEGDLAPNSKKPYFTGSRVRTAGVRHPAHLPACGATSSEPSTNARSRN